LPLLKRKQQKMSWSIFQHWQGVETSVWYHRICADSVQSATTPEGKRAAASVRKACYHIDCDLEKVENITGHMSVQIRIFSIALVSRKKKISGLLR